MTYVHSHMFQHIGPSVVLEPVNVQWIYYITRYKKTHRYGMYRIQEVYKMIPVKPVLHPIFTAKKVNFPAAKVETVVGSWGRLFGLRTRLQAGRSGVRIPMWERDFCFLENA
jgi:hypothetical protein